MDFKLEEYILPDRPYIICYMMQSLDGSSYGDWSQYTIETFKQVQIQEPNFKAKGIINGSSTMEKLYLPKDYKIDLSPFKNQKINKNEDFKSNNNCTMYLIGFDGKGKLQYKQSNYDCWFYPRKNEKVEFLNVVTEQVSDEYLLYLRSINVSYIIAGKDKIDIKIALTKLKNLFGIDKCLLEGGSILNGVFIDVDCIDEVAVFVAPILGNINGKPIINIQKVVNLEFLSSQTFNKGDILLRYKVKK